MYSGCWTKTKTAKSGKYRPSWSIKRRRRISSLIYGRFVRLTPKTEQKRSRTNADFLPDCFSFPQRHDSRSRSPHKTQAADSLLFFAAFNRKRAAILKPSLFQKTLHQIAQYSAQYFMQYFTIYFLICSCISGYYVVYFNQDKGKTQRQRSITWNARKDMITWKPHITM